ncbi:LOW QUALITY PROTEIN: S-methyl-5'-thioadenosine phosphorylase-like [Haliotis rubra]|uniref:LOW QUALITY PROTEIN: S-methyl-5'-thioadenosine phosphorylase-like n=1 Tax=Haliotis rubra TaxID=36100 RepID=UPI001EE57AC5|nr:LOW QUALITY PROTEIN: S-methyl-5'-thioadenosine phosphorylase-like [Haliotis rubra]
MSKVKVGIIGGSGLDNPDILENRQAKYVETPFGKPSDCLVVGTISGIECVLLARHGRQHTLMPSNVNYRANVEALKAEGCTHLVVTTACGSLHEDMHPGDIVVIDQFIDRTQKRALTFYDGSSSSHRGVCHIPMNEPFCSRTRQILCGCLKDLGYSHHSKGTMVTIEGPRFSSKAESKMFRLWEGHVINMSTVPEVALAKEAGLCYASLALVTDYDSWREDTAAVNVELAVKAFKENAVKAVNTLKKAIPRIAEEDWTDTIAEYRDIAKRSVMLPPE